MQENSELSQFGKKVQFTANTGIKAVRLDTDGITLLMPFEHNINHVGVMYAGALFTLAECMGGAVTVEVSYDHFPLTMPFIGAILGRQDLSLSATVVDTILTPACQ